MIKSAEIKPELIISPRQLRDNYERVQQIFDGLPGQVPDIKVSEYAERHRKLPEGTPHSGPWRNAMTPYAVEIMDELSVTSRTREVIWIKCSQIGATSIVENFIMYIISQVPGPIMYVSSKEALLKKWVAKRLAPALNSCKLDGRIFAQHLMKGQRRTGNQMFSKEFPGGALDMVSAQAEDNLRMDSIRYLILDEAGKYPMDVEGFGDPIEIAKARTANWRSRAKVFIPSTPGLEGECRMWDLYQEGDQRRYFVPCPHCGAFQVLKLPSEPTYFYKGFAAVTMEWETKAGRLDKKSIHFKCMECKREVFEDHKADIVRAGKWAPTAQPVDDLKKSYQIGRLYSLMDDWERIIKSEIKGTTDPSALQVHHNHVCGIPFRETTIKMDKAKVYELRGTYKAGTIPSDDVLFLTAAVDVQRGSETDLDKPARLELEICGHGNGYKTWSILYKVFPGVISDPYDGAWEDLYQFVASGNWIFLRSDGFKFTPNTVFVDSGDGENETTVFDFCSRLKRFYPIKGSKELIETKQGRKTAQMLDIATPRDRDKWRLSTKNGSQYVLIYTNWYKRRLYRAIAVSIKQRHLEEKKALYCDFPTDYPDKYFDMLVAEEERSDQTFWLASGRANEALDLRVYNLCAGEFYLFLATQALQRRKLREGHSKEHCANIFAKHAIAEFVQALARKDVTPPKASVSKIVPA